jgi:hypothetical protein
MSISLNSCTATGIKDAKKKTTKQQKQKYLEFIMEDETQKVLTEIPKSRQHKYLREAFEFKTEIKISEYLHSKVMKAIKNKQISLGEKTFVII